MLKTNFPSLCVSGGQGMIDQRTNTGEGKGMDLKEILSVLTRFRKCLVFVFFQIKIILL